MSTILIITFVVILTGVDAILSFKDAKKRREELDDIKSRLEKLEKNGGEKNEF